MRSDELRLQKQSTETIYRNNIVSQDEREEQRAGL